MSDFRGQCSRFADPAMPKYFFQVIDGKGLVDDEGADLENLAAAMREATRYAGCLLKENKTDIRPDVDWSLRVSDCSGQTIFQIDLRLHVHAENATRVRGLSNEKPRLQTRRPAVSI